MKKIFSFVAAALTSVTLCAEQAELKLYATTFQNWDAVTSSTSISTKTVTTRYSNEPLTISFCETQIAPEGTNSKFTKDFITTGYAMAAKTATPYIETSALASITKVHYVHAATGGTRGWGLQAKGDGDADWVTVYSTYCDQAGSAVDVAINRTNVQLRWYNLNGSQNAYMTEFAIYGMAEDDGQPMEYTIRYYDQNGNHLGDTIQTENETLDFMFGEEDLDIPAGYKFRGWYDGDKKRHNEGETLTEDMRLNALVTPIEVAELGKFYIYNLASSVFYEDDHECFIPANGAFHNEHGWHFAPNGSISLPVAGNAYVKIGLCKHSDEGEVVVTTKSGAAVTSFPSKVTNDNTVHTFYYEGAADTLVMTFVAQAYIHSVAVYNVAGRAEKTETGYYELASGDVAAFLMVLEQLQDGDKIFLPNGTYDLGDICLTEITKNNISIIGQSMDGVLIVNHPAVAGMNKSETLHLRGENIYLQDLGIRCDVSYPGSVADGVGIAIQVRGDKNIMKNVSLQGNQDTYLSSGQPTQRGWIEDCRLEGTVDYVCGTGNIWFENTLFYNNARSTGDVIFAPSTDANTVYGYVVNNCTIESAEVQEGIWCLARGWKAAAAVTFLNTTCKSMPTAKGYRDMTAGLKVRFHEYNTHKEDGTPITGHNLDNLGYSAESDAIYMTNDSIYTYANVILGADNWDAASEAAQAEAETEASQLDPDGIYLIESEGEFQAIIKGSEFMDKFALYDGKVYTIRKANARGGFGPKAGEAPQGIEETVSHEMPKVIKIIRDGQVIIVRGEKAYTLFGQEVK